MRYELTERGRNQLEKMETAILDEDGNVKNEHEENPYVESALVMLYVLKKIDEEGTMLIPDKIKEPLIGHGYVIQIR